MPSDFDFLFNDAISSSSGLENREYGLGIRHADHVEPSIRKSRH
jgi:hypothetical protein